MININFTKMEGTGNDFIIIDQLTTNNSINDNKLAKILCHRKKGIGADQLVILRPSLRADFLMNNYNPDGTQVEICGNALRALALYIRQNNYTSAKTITIETLAGIKTVMLNDDNTIFVNMSHPSFSAEDIGLTKSGVTNLIILDKTFEINYVSMGNPHCVIVTNENLDNFPLETYGKLIETNSLFANHINVEFIKKIAKNHLQMRVWERGVGLTDSCGSGACASAVIAIKLGLIEEPNQLIKVSLPGGDLSIKWQNQQEVYMTGPATTTFKGTFQID